MRQGLEYKKQVLGRWPAARDIFLPGGKAPEIGHVIYQPDLADTMEALAEHGLDGFYAGDVARRMVAEVRAEGGIWTEQDLADYRVVERPPVVFDYRGATIVAAAPPSAGGIALANMFNILSGYRLDQFDRVGQVHLAVEAMRRAYRDRAEYLGDPDFVDIPVERLTHPLYAAGQRTSIRMDRATPSNLLPGYLPKEGGADTTHFSIIDADGNRVAGTQSINSWFGSGFMVPGTGVLLNNEMDDFAIKPGVENLYQLVGAAANSVAPGKRMLSSMTPTFVESDRGVLILGTPGGSRIISMVLLGILEWLDGADVDAIAALPRFHHQYLPDKIFHEEKAFDADERRALEAKGHTLQQSSRLYGNMQAVSWEFESGEVKGASDPRNEGGATVRVY
jgi:gamma-glutamyltranspeptidase/glutathione hydrolase